MGKLIRTRCKPRVKFERQAPRENTIARVLHENIDQAQASVLSSAVARDSAVNTFVEEGMSKERAEFERKHMANMPLMKVLHSHRNDGMWEKHGPIWRKNCEANKWYIEHAASNQTLPTYLMAPNHIIVGAGPGLDLVLDELRDIRAENARLARPKYTIWCCDMAYLPMRKANIIPSAVVSIDQADWAIPKMLKYESVRHPACCFGVTSSPRGVREWRGKRLFFVVEQMIEQLKDICPDIRFLPRMQPFGNVTGAAMFMAQTIGGQVAKRIAFVGNDLCYPVIGNEVWQYCRNTYRANMPDGRCLLNIKEDMPEDEGRPRPMRISYNRTVPDPIRPGATLQEQGHRDVFITNIMAFYNQTLLDWFKLDHKAQFYNCSPSMMDLHHGKSNMVSCSLAAFRKDCDADF